LNSSQALSAMTHPRDKWPAASHKHYSQERTARRLLFACQKAKNRA
jgi:hypothetical protein